MGTSMTMPKGHRHTHIEGQKECAICFEIGSIRENIAMEIEGLFDGIVPKNEFIAKHAPVDAYEIVWRAARIARGHQ